MDKLRAAFAADDGKYYIDRHFGDADYYDLYEISAEGVNTAVSRVFGPNLKRIKNKFLCVMYRSGDIKSGIAGLQENYSALQAELARGEERDFLRF